MKAIMLGRINSILEGWHEEGPEEDIISELELFSHSFPPQEHSGQACHPQGGLNFLYPLAV